MAQLAVVKWKYGTICFIRRAQRPQHREEEIDARAMLDLPAVWAIILLCCAPMPILSLLWSR